MLVSMMTTGEYFTRYVTSEPMAENVTSEPMAEGVTSEPIAEGVTSEPMAEHVTSEALAEIVTSKPIAEAATSEPIAEAAMSEPEPEYARSEPEPERPIGEPESEFWTSEPFVEPGAEAEAWAEGSVEPQADPEALEDAELYVWLIIYSIWIVFTVLGNAIIIRALLRKKSYKTKPVDLLLLALVVARTLVGLFVVPSRITGLYSEEYLGSILCKLCHYTSMSSSVSSIMFTTSIAVTKYRETVRQMPEAQRRIIVNILIICFVAFVYSTRAAFLHDLIEIELPSGDIWSCAIPEKHRRVDNIMSFVDFGALFALPLIIIVFCYRKVLKHELQKKKTTQKINSKLTISDKQLQQMQKASLSTIQMIIVVSILFTACSIAPYVWKLYVRCGAELPSEFRFVNQVVYLISYSNPWLNVIVILYFRPDLRVWRGSAGGGKVVPVDETPTKKKMKERIDSQLPIANKWCTSVRHMEPSAK